MWSGAKRKVERDDWIMRIFMLGAPHGILLERANQEREHLKNLGVD